MKYTDEQINFACMAKILSRIYSELHGVMVADIKIIKELAVLGLAFWKSKLTDSIASSHEFMTAELSKETNIELEKFIGEHNARINEASDPFD